jgi:protein-S-isoprenylcysteine O-methyltransferase Ste14
MRAKTMRILSILYGVGAYLFFLVSFLYAVAFIGDLPAPKTIDSGAAGPLGLSLLIDLVLLGVFAIQHSVMARPAFKAVWTRVVPPVVERSTYVLLSTLALDLLCWQWRPLPATVWDVGPGLAAAAVWGLFVVGWAVLLTSTFLINHFDLFGLRQVWTYRRQGQEFPPEFHTPLFYRVVRHPLYLGFLIAFWAAPVMSQGRLLFAAGSTAYVLIAIQLEEHDLIDVFGERYRDYRRRVSMLLPWPPRG